jgi:hypothetical protein
MIKCIRKRERIKKQKKQKTKKTKNKKKTKMDYYTCTISRQSCINFESYYSKVVKQMDEDGRTNGRTRTMVVESSVT